MKKNGFGDKISVIGKRSTELSMEEDGNCQSRANLLVTELWDTELIGEGALPTLRDACNRLLEPGFVSVPAAATIYAQVIGSDALWSMHQLNPQQTLDNQDITLPADMEDCRGTASGFDLHVDELSDEEIHIFTSPVPIVRVEFCSGCQSKNTHCTNRVSIPETKDKVDSDKTVSHYHVEASVTQTGPVHGVVMWWSLDMDMNGEIILSTAPRWVHPDDHKRQWRDHWMQAVYFLKTPLAMQEGDKINVHCYHDDYSIWFDVTPVNRIVTTVDRPLCTCGAHVTWSRHRFAMMNDRKRSQAFKEALRQLVAEGHSRCLCISDGSLLPIMAAKLGFEKVITVESSVLFQKLLKKIMDLNGIADKIEILSQEESDLQIRDLSTVQVDVIIGEPFFTSCLFPWHNLYFWYAAASAARVSKPAVKILPKGATLKAIAVEFDDLWKFHAPVNIVEGFDISLFDELIEGSKLTNEEINSESSDGIALEPHHLWEYPCHPLTQEFTLMEFDFTSNIPSQKMAGKGEAKLTRPGTFHGVAIWMDFHLNDKLTVTTGLQQVRHD